MGQALSTKTLHIGEVTSSTNFEGVVGDIVRAIGHGGIGSARQGGTGKTLARGGLER